MNLLATTRRKGALLGAALALSHCAPADAEPHAGDATKAPAADESVAGECGAQGQPMCPTQAWMRATVQPSMLAGDLPRLNQLLITIAERAPEGYSEWKAIARTGATAAKNEDLAGVRTSCKSCHDSYRSKFRQQHRQAQIFER